MPRWPKDGAPSPKEAMALQEEWSARVVRRVTFGGLRSVALVGGADVGVRGDVARAAACVLRYPTLEVLETARVTREVRFPYVPGLLGFREVPALAEAFARLSLAPDVVLVDGHGIAHPRRFGVATHLGLELDLPTVGVGKSPYVGTSREPGPKRGARAALRHEGEAIGAVLRTRAGVKPVWVSIGNGIDLDTAVRLVLRCTGRFRLPEPIRAAHRAAVVPPAPAAGKSGARGR